MDLSNIQQERIKYYRAKFGEGHYHFACYAAVTLLFSPDYLYKLLHNFNDYTDDGDKIKKISYLAVSDLLLSNLCRPIGYQLYKMEEEIRAALLKELNLTKKKQIARFTKQYAEKRFTSFEKHIQQTYWVAAERIINPEGLAKKIREKLLAPEKKETEKLRLLNQYFELYPQGEAGEGIGLIFENAQDEDIGEILEIRLNKRLQQEVNSQTQKVEIAEQTIFGSTIEDAKKIIQEAKEKKLKKIDLGNLGITDLNELPELLDCKHLEVLDLRNNKITYIELAFLNNLNNLKELYLQSNPIQNIPKEIFDKDENCLEEVRGYLKSLAQIKNLERTLKIRLSENTLDKIMGLRESSNTYVVNEKGQIIALNLSWNKAKDLSILAEITSLTHLDLGGVQLNDFSFLIPLQNLQFLIIARTKLSDISFLKELRNLEVIYLDHNEITDFPLDLLANLPNLKELYLKGNSIQKIPPEFFDKEGNCLEEVKAYFFKDSKPQVIIQIEKELGVALTRSTLERVFDEVERNTYSINQDGKIESLNIHLGKVPNIHFVNALVKLTMVDLSELTHLYLQENGVIDISFVKNLANITHLDLGKNQIFNLSALENLSQLTYLNLAENRITDISNLSGLKKLVSLNLNNNAIGEHSMIEGLESLETLFLIGNSIENISFLKKLKNLRILNLRANQIKNIEAIQSLQELEELSLFRNKLQDILPIQYLTKLKKLDISENNIESIPILNNLKELQNIFFGRNYISDIAVLKNLRKLVFIDARFNQIKEFPIDLLNVLNDLKEIYLTGNPIQNIPKEIFNQEGNCLNELNRFFFKQKIRYFGFGFRLELHGKQKEKFQEALISAFPKYVELEQMLSFKLNKNLREIAIEDNLKDVTFQLIQTADAEGWLLDLVVGAIAQKLGNGKLKAFIKSLDVSLFIEIMNGFLELGDIDIIFILLKTIHISKNIHEISKSLFYRWESLKRKEGLISLEELENERSIIISGLYNVLELLGKKTSIADSDFFLLYPHIKEKISLKIEIFEKTNFKNYRSVEKALFEMSKVILDVLSSIVELAKRYAGNFDKKSFVYGANIMLMVNSKNTLAEEIAGIYQDNFLFRNGIEHEDLLGILYLPEGLAWKPENSNQTVPIALPIYKTDGAENPKPPLLGAPFAAIYGVSIVRDVSEIKNHASDELKEEIETYFSEEGLGKNIKSIASFRIGTPKNPIGVLNIDSNKANLLGDQPELYTVFIANLDPILRKLSGIIEQFAELYVRKLLQKE